MPMGRYTFSVDSMSFMAHVVKPDRHSADSSYPSENRMRYYVHHRFQKGKDQQRVCKFFISMTLSIIIPPGQKILDEDTRALFTGTEFKASVQAKSKLVKLLT